MSDHWQDIQEFYSKKGIFTCKNRGKDKLTCEIEVSHQLFPAATQTMVSKLEKWSKQVLPASYKAFLLKINGGVFFTQKKGENYNSGFILFSVEDIPDAHSEALEELIELIDDEDSYLFDEDDVDGKKACRKWVKSILVVGEEIDSGNYIAIDFNRKKHDGEYPFIFIDHETPFSCSDIEDDDSILANTASELLYKAAQDPADFLMNKLGATATYSDGKSNEQWYPKKYKTI